MRGNRDATVSEEEAGRVSATADDQENSVWLLEQERKGEVSKATALQTEGGAISPPIPPSPTPGQPHEEPSCLPIPFYNDLWATGWGGPGADTDPWRAEHSQSLGLHVLSSCENRH